MQPVETDVEDSLQPAPVLADVDPKQQNTEGRNVHRHLIGVHQVGGPFIHLLVERILVLEPVRDHLQLRPNDAKDRHELEQGVEAVIKHDVQDVVRLVGVGFVEGERAGVFLLPHFIML